ncbi:MAG: hypothetical protein WC179_06910 [Candidatus Cloacimonadaceae bacterium]
MDGTLIVIMAIATMFNFIILKWKLEKERYADFVFDILCLIAISWLFAGTLGGMVIAMTSSALISLYLIAFPPKFLKDFA